MPRSQEAMWNSASGTVEVAPNERKHPLSSVRLRACNMRGAGNPGLRTGMKLLIRDGHPTALATLQRLAASELYGDEVKQRFWGGRLHGWSRAKQIKAMHSGRC